MPAVTISEALRRGVPGRAGRGAVTATTATESTTRSRGGNRDERDDQQWLRNAEDPWRLKTPPLSSDYTMHRDTRDGLEVIVCTVGKTVLLYDARCLDDLRAMLVKHGDWMELGSADEQKPAKEGTVEAWGRSTENPVGGWYGLKKGLRGRFGMYVPPLMEHLGLAEVEHNARGNRMRAT